MKAVRFLVTCATIWVSQCPNPCPNKIYFGPDCRYLNLRHIARQVIVNGETTVNGLECYSASSKNPIKTVEVSLDGRHIGWIRVDVRDKQATSKLDIKLWRNNTNVRKLLEKRVVSGITVDVQFKYYGQFVTHVLVEGDVLDTCDVYISQGQNLPKNFEDRALASTKVSKISARRCVDENVKTYGVEYGEAEAWWKFVFPFPAGVYRVELDNKFIYCDNRTVNRNHTLEIYSCNQSRIFDTSGKNIIPQPIYNYDINTKCVPAASLKVVSHYAKTSRFRLNYREIYIWGDYMCKSLMFGPDSQHNCNCFEPKEQCFLNTGGCPDGCAVGYKGTKCSVKCGPFNSECPSGYDNVNRGGCCGCAVGCTGPSCAGSEAGCTGQSCNHSGAACNGPSCAGSKAKCTGPSCIDNNAACTFPNKLPFNLLTGCLLLVLVLLLM